MTLSLEHYASCVMAHLKHGIHTVSPAALDDASVGVLLNCISVPPRSRRRCDACAAVTCVHA
jgi:hypothetical protein